MGRNPPGAHDLILVAALPIAASGHFYPAMVLWFVWGWLNKRRYLRFRDAQRQAGDQSGVSFTVGRHRVYAQGGVQGDNAGNADTVHRPSRLAG